MILYFLGWAYNIHPIYPYGGSLRKLHRIDQRDWYEF